MSVQSKQEMDDFYSSADPWGYYNNPHDATRKARILAALPQQSYETALDIGSGNGFITNQLPAHQVIGLEFSEKAVTWANEHAASQVKYINGSLFDLPDLNLPPMDLIVITGVLYPQYLGKSLRLAYTLIDQILKPGGILLCSHIYEWYYARFPYLTISREYFAYREYSQVLEVYVK
jgi:SAM-dependent methyltransferase